MKTDGVFGGRITQALIPGRSSRVRWSRNKADVAKNFERQIRKMFVIVGNQKRTCKVNVRVQGTVAPLLR
jgi:hypothetical protein